MNGGNPLGVKAENRTGSPWSQGRAKFARQGPETGNESAAASTRMRASVCSGSGKG